MIAMEAIDTIKLLTDLQFFGHCLMQRMQEMHFLESALKVTGSIAPTGQFEAHKPHFVQPLPTFGTRPAPPAFL